MNNENLAELLFPNVIKTPDYYEELYPARVLKEGAKVTRFAPSPTGFLHIGGLFAAMIANLCAKTSDGVFFLRIEDTDKKREIEDGVSEIIRGLAAFNIVPDEGVEGFNEESGNYGPYQQSHRKEIYQCFAKELVKKGLAYPCFCTEEELNSIRDKQEQAVVNKGYYKEWAVCRNLAFEQVEQNIKNGMPFVLRLRSDGDENHRITVDDLIRGKVEMPENIQDVVILKTDGIPTYHFAHAVDDHLMRTNLVVRGDEWLSSLPIHIALFRSLEFKAPKYAHISPIMKEENGGKRKLSKRKDPEAAVTYYAEQGYPSESVIEYLLTLANSNFEDWRRANPNEDTSKFPFSIKKMSASGALFDIIKLNDVSKNVICVMTAENVYKKTLFWAKTYEKEIYSLFSENPEKAVAIFNIDRPVSKPRKDIAKWSDIKDYISYFYNELYVPKYELPENIKPEDGIDILNAYISAYNFNDDKNEWFERIKTICDPLGFTTNVKEYKQNPDAFKGHVGDISTVIRLAITSRTNTPDLFAIMQVLGYDEVIKRLQNTLHFFEEVK